MTWEQRHNIIALYRKGSAKSWIEAYCAEQGISEWEKTELLTMLSVPACCVHCENIYSYGNRSYPCSECSRAMSDMFRVRKLRDKYVEVLEQSGWRIDKYSINGEVTVSFDSPAGKTVTTTFNVDSFPDAIAKCAENFDIDDWALQQIRNQMQPKVSACVEDAAAVRKILENTAKALMEVR